MKKFALLVACLAVAVTGLDVSSAWGQSSADVEKARLKGMDYIKSEQFDDGSWEQEGHDVGITSLCAMALIENGMPVSDPVIESAHKFVKKEYLEQKGTYDIALAILFMSRVGDRDNRSPIRDLAARLIAGQNIEGGWGYSCPGVTAGILSNPEDRPKPQAGVGDNSCTQFAVLGLWVASRWGVDIEDTMSLVGERFMETQREDGGWPYRCEEWSKALADATATPEEPGKDEEKPAEGPPKRKRKEDKGNDKEDAPMPVANNLPGGDSALPGADGVPLPGAPGAPAAGSEADYMPSSPSMTFAGLFCLTVARATVIRSEKNKARTGDSAAPAVAAGETLLSNPSFEDGLKRASLFAAGMGHGRYFMWSVERMGVILGMEKFGETDWFGEGSKALIASQEMDGSWKGPHGDLADSSFAILFLRKANLGSDISRLLSGEPADRFQNVTQAEKPRYISLEVALKAAQPGDRIRIDGAGPFPMPHLEITQDLTIEAGFGYTPVLKYDIGFDPDGRRSKPQDNPDARHMIRVSKGILTLEGLDFQMDPPEGGTGIPWAAVVANGGTLRMLNCSVSEGNKQNIAGVRVTAPGQVTLRNSSFVCGRAGIEILSNGDQQVTLENCSVFAKSAFAIADAPKGAAGKCTLTINRTAVQSADAFLCKGLTHELDIITDGVAFQGDSMGSNMLSAPTGHKGITWSGNSNMYDLKAKGWIGSGGKVNPLIKDPKAWNTFWGGKDLSGAARPIAFAARRTVGQYSHTVKGEDFEFSSTSEIYAYRRRTGIDVLVIGPGPGFSRFRESFDYRSWVNGDALAVAATEATK